MPGSRACVAEAAEICDHPGQGRTSEGCRMIDFAAAREAMVEYLNWEGMGYPTTLVFDRKGIIRGGWIGYTSGDERRLSALVKQLLAEKSR